MQLYRFACPACSHEFRRIFSDQPPAGVTCPQCGGTAGKVEGNVAPAITGPAFVGRAHIDPHASTRRPVAALIDACGEDVGG